MKEQHEPPTTIKEVGIHVGYLREDLSEIKGTLKSLADGAVSRKDHDSLVLRVERVETLIEKVKSRIVGAAITIFVGMVLALYGLDKFFK